METVGADVAIIGGGVTGCAVAYHLAKRGASVVLLEKSHLASESSGRNAGGVRQQGRHPAELPLAIRGRSLWQTLGDEMGCDTEYRSKGNLWLALDEADLALLDELNVRHERAGLATRLFSAREAASMVPKLGIDLYGGLFCPGDGEANPLKTTFGLARAAKKLGARVYERAEVTKILTKKGRVVGVDADGLRIRAANVVNCAGPWAGLICAMAGHSLPIKICRNHICATEPTDDLGIPFILSSKVYLRQTVRGNLIFGNVNPPDFVGFEDRNKPEISQVSVCAKNLFSMFFSFAGLTVIRCWAGVLDLTPDDIPIIGGLPGLKGFYVAAGFSGHGFALAPAVGEALSELITNGKSTIDIQAFSPERFMSDSAKKTMTGSEVFAYGQAVKGR